MTLSAFAWNIVRTYTLTPGRRYSFGCRYRLGTASNLVMYVSAADNNYVGVTGTFLGTPSQGVWSTARLDFSVPPGGVTKLHFGAFGGSIPGLVQQSAGTLDLYIRAGLRDGCWRTRWPLRARPRTAQGNVGDQLLRNDVNCTDVFTWTPRAPFPAQRSRPQAPSLEPRCRPQGPCQVELRDDMPLVRVLGRQGASASTHAAGFSRSHACTHRKAAEEVISLSSCGGSNKHYRESKKARKRELGIFFFSGSDSLRPAAAQPQRQCRSGPQRRGPHKELHHKARSWCCWFSACSPGSASTHPVLPATTSMPRCLGPAGRSSAEAGGSGVPELRELAREFGWDWGRVTGFRPQEGV